MAFYGDNERGISVKTQDLRDVEILQLKKRVIIGIYRTRHFEYSIADDSAPPVLLPDKTTFKIYDIRAY